MALRKQEPVSLLKGSSEVRLVAVRVTFIDEVMQICLQELGFLRNALE